MKQEYLVCIGGPSDGQRVHLDPHSRYYNVSLPMTTNVWDGPNTYKTIVYERHAFAAPNLKIDVLVPMGEKPDVILRALIEGYRGERS
jgi:hypothetical protein